MERRLIVASLSLARWLCLGLYMFSCRHTGAMVVIEGRAERHSVAVQRSVQALEHPSAHTIPRALCCAHCVATFRPPPSTPSDTSSLDLCLLRVCALRTLRPREMVGALVAVSTAAQLSCQCHISRSSAAVQAFAIAAQQVSAKCSPGRRHRLGRASVPSRAGGMVGSTGATLSHSRLRTRTVLARPPGTASVP